MLPPMKQFEVVLAGFDASTGKTDDLVKWVVAPSLEAVKKFFRDTALHTEPRIMRDTNGEGVDFVLNENGVCPDRDCADSFENAYWYRNHYKCPCGCEWDDEWSCMCNDRCPDCNAEIEPYESEEI